MVWRGRAGAGAMAPEKHGELRDSLPPPQRLALAYAPSAVRDDWLAFLAFDARLAGIVQRNREVMLGQLRFAWWRDQLASEGPPRAGEPLLALLVEWGEHRKALGALVDGWEAALDPDADRLAVAETVGEARGAALAALAGRVGCGEIGDLVKRAGREWTLAEFGVPDGQSAAIAPVRLPRSLRPLAMLHGLARQATKPGKCGLLDRPMDLLTAMRIGLLGR